MLGPALGRARLLLEDVDDLEAPGSGETLNFGALALGSLRVAAYTVVQRGAGSHAGTTTQPPFGSTRPVPKSSFLATHGMACFLGSAQGLKDYPIGIRCGPSRGCGVLLGSM